MPVKSPALEPAIYTLCSFGPNADADFGPKNHPDLDEKLGVMKCRSKSAHIFSLKKMPLLFIVLKISHFNTLSQPYFDRSIWYQNFLFIFH